MYQLYHVHSSIYTRKNMGHHHHHLLSFHYGSKKEGGLQHLPPKGCMTVRVGQSEGEQEKFVVPVNYLNHPLFIGLLKEAEEEYGFEHKGAIAIPCHVEYFRQVRGIIDRDSGRGRVHSQQHHLPFHLSSCFKA